MSKKKYTTKYERTEAKRAFFIYNKIVTKVLTRNSLFWVLLSTKKRS